MKKKFIAKKLEKIKKIMHGYLELEDDGFIDFVLAVYVANKLNGDPLWGGIVGAPSSTKTEILMAMDCSSDINLISSLTQRTLISGKRGYDNKDNSLILELNGKLLVIKDLTTILSLRNDVRNEIFGQLREIYDGKFTKHFGTGDKTEWKGKIGVLFACTPVIESQLSFNSMLGPRFLIYRISHNKHEKIASTALNHTLNQEKHRKKLKNALNDFMKDFKGKIKSNVGINDEMQKRLVALAILCAHARTAVHRNSYTKQVEIMPELEVPARLIKQLKLLAISLAIIRGLDEVDSDVYKIVRHVGLGSIPSIRLRIIKALWKLLKVSKNGKFTINEVSEQSNIPATTTKLCLEDLSMLKLVEQFKTGKGKTATYQCRLSKKAVKLMSLI